MKKMLAVMIPLMLLGSACRGPDKSKTLDGAADNAAESREVVVLLHGLARSSSSMRKMERELQDAGFMTVNRGYPSRKKSVEELTEDFVKPLVDEILEKQNPDRIHFVTHSLGGILVRYYAAEYGTARIGRVVMLAPPNHGSELPDRLKGLAPYRWYFGDAGQELGTGEDDVPARLPPAQFEVGVLAGTRSWWNPLAWFWLSGDSDGTVTVESTRLEGMSDFRKVSSGHTFIMRRSEVIESTKQFLKKGRFDDD